MHGVLRPKISHVRNIKNTQTMSDGQMLLFDPAILGHRYPPKSDILAPNWCECQKMGFFHGVLNKNITFRS